jgi:hypothetical protein
MMELHEFSGGTARTPEEEPMLVEIGEKAAKWRRLSLKWERACKAYEAALKSGGATPRTKDALQRALNSLMKVRKEIDRFVSANRVSKQRPGEPFFVGMINFAST